MDCYTSPLSLCVCARADELGRYERARHEKKRIEMLMTNVNNSLEKGLDKFPFFLLLHAVGQAM